MVENYHDKMNNYIRKNLAKGYTEEALKWSLIQQGYSRTDVARAIERVSKERNYRNPMNEKPVIRREVYDESNMPVIVQEQETPWYKSITSWVVIVFIIFVIGLLTKRLGYW